MSPLIFFWIFRHWHFLCFVPLTFLGFHACAEIGILCRGRNPGPECTVWRQYVQWALGIGLREWSAPRGALYSQERSFSSRVEGSSFQMHITQWWEITLTSLWLPFRGWSPWTFLGNKTSVMKGWRVGSWAKGGEEWLREMGKINGYW